MLDPGLKPSATSVPVYSIAAAHLPSTISQYGILFNSGARRMERPDDGEWKARILRIRGEKDEWMRTSPDSPMPDDIRHHMKWLEYFPPNREYIFRVRLIPYPNPETLMMATSKGQQKEFLRFGRIEFGIEGKMQTLQAYRSVPSHDHRHEEESLFVPFRDATSGKETYGAARYLDLEFNPSGEYVLDFNLAYNPYCAYSEDYICPFPPPENWLKVAILAGEKTFRKE